MGRQHGASLPLAAGRCVSIRAHMESHAATAPAPAARRVPRSARGFAAELTLPGSKSIALRHILMSSLAASPTTLRGLPRCDDADAMLAAVARLGVLVERSDGAVRLTPAAAAPADTELDLRMSGVSLRFLLARAMLLPATTRFTGHPQLHQRPNADLLAALAAVGCKVESADGRLPIAIAGPRQPRAETTLRTDVSSQYLSALLLSAPALPRGLTIRLQGARTSASYIDVTAAEMARRGVAVETLPATAVRVPPGRYRGGEVLIEGDASAATYHAALATLHGGTVTFANLGSASQQGDCGFLRLCERAGATVTETRTTTTVQGPAKLAAVGRADMTTMPDAAPTLMALAPFLPAPTRITGLATLRVKECDRLAAGATELRKAGATVHTEPAAMTIAPAPKLRPAAFDTYEDHRMAMALSVLASGIGGCEIRDPGCVAKTYADYWRDFEQVCRGA